MRRITIAVPAAHINIANHYAMTLGYSEADSLTYRNPSWQDAQGNLYSVASLPVSDGFVSTATSSLARPEWDTEEIIDTSKASQAQSLVTLWTTTDETPAPLAQPNQITAILGLEGVAAIEAMGLTTVSQEDTV